ncbi:MAG: UDP-N-acetylglucosamine 1-carboxyvinyltransferase [Clostridiales bacterium]|nr:UDP-N-acetylglucosamine 1-carboxyvinyltransferase [Clostridiales bacterium]
MERIVVEGGHPLRGEVKVEGAKNAILPAMAAALLAKEPTVLEGAPPLKDVEAMAEILGWLGVEVKRDGPQTWVIDPALLSRLDLPEELSRKLRSSLFLLGPLLARFGQVEMGYPGGCSIGARPIDFHLKGLRQMGVEVLEETPIVKLRAAELRGADIYLAYPSVGATENLMMAATLARGTTTIRNAAKEPEVVDLARLLSAMGARIRGAGSDVVVVEGVQELHGVRHRIIPDRIEAGTFLLALAATGGEGAVTGVNPGHLYAVLDALHQMGCQARFTRDTIRLRAPGRVKPVDIRTQPYPGFPTDLQNPALAVLLKADGTSIITESVFESRFRVVEELRRMGAQVQVDGRLAVVRGVPRLKGARLMAQELRGAAALLIAALSAEGVSTLEGVQHLDRGYSRLEEKLSSLGAVVERRVES